MPDPRSERLKLYIVIVLVIVSVVVAYFRFFYKKAAPQAKPSPTAVAPGQFKMPAIQIKDALARRRQTMPKDEHSHAIIRDIFEAPKSLEKSSEQLPGENPDVPEAVLPFRLKGTIMGGGSPVAFVNDQFVRPGEQIDGFKVIRISENEILLDSGEKEIRLELVPK
jgi:hypothetical protein